MLDGTVISIGCCPQGGGIEIEQIYNADFAFCILQVQTKVQIIHGSRYERPAEAILINENHQPAILQRTVLKVQARDSMFLETKTE